MYMQEYQKDKLLIIFSWFITVYIANSDTFDFSNINYLYSNNSIAITIEIIDIMVVRTISLKLNLSIYIYPNLLSYQNYPIILVNLPYFIVGCYKDSLYLEQFIDYS